jgi:hypothetical protein
MQQQAGQPERSDDAFSKGTESNQFHGTCFVRRNRQSGRLLRNSASAMDPKCSLPSLQEHRTRCLESAQPSLSSHTLL